MKAKVEGSGLIVKVNDRRLSFDSVWRLRGLISELVGAEHRHIALDISEVENIDSKALGALVSIAQLLGDGDRLVIVGPRGGVMGMLRLTRLDRVFRVVSDARQAMDLLNGAEAAAAEIQMEDSKEAS